MKRKDIFEAQKSANILAFDTLIGIELSREKTGNAVAQAIPIPENIKRRYREREEMTLSIEETALKILQQTPNIHLGSTFSDEYIFTHQFHTRMDIFMGAILFNNENKGYSTRATRDMIVLGIVRGNVATNELELENLPETEKLGALLYGTFSQDSYSLSDATIGLQPFSVKKGDEILPRNELVSPEVTQLTNTYIAHKKMQINQDEASFYANVLDYTQKQFGYIESSPIIKPEPKKRKTKKEK